MKIAQVSSQAFPVPPVRYGGLERIVYDLSYCLARLGHEVTVFAPTDSHVENCRMFDTGNLDEQDAFEVCKEELKKFDIIHSHTWSGLANLLRADGFKVINTYHGPWLGYRYTSPMNVVGISQSHAMLLAGQIGENVQSAYNGICVEDYSFYPGPRSDRLLFMNRITPEKGIGLALYLAKKYNWKMDIVGTTFGCEEGWAAFVIQRCDGDQIRYCGELELEMKREMLQQAKGLLWLTPMFEEPFGMGLVEAGLCGTPIVAMPRGAIPEIISGGANGYLASSETEIVEAVDSLGLIDPGACRKTMERFSRENMAERYLELYGEVIGNGHKPI